MNYELNQRLPYMTHNWLTHASRTSRLTREQRGLLDEVRCELWQVVGVRMLRAGLMERLNIAPGTNDEQMLDTLIRRGNLTQDAEGWVFDQVLLHEWNEALRKAEVNRQNGAKGGRRKSPNSVRGHAPGVEQVPCFKHASSSLDDQDF